MKRKPNYLKHILQWGVLAAIAGTVLWANFSEKPVDVEAYCPFGGLQAFGTYLVNNSLACSMSMVRWAPSANGWAAPERNCICRSRFRRAAS